MREKLNRGKRTDNGEWVYGAYINMHHNDGRTHIHHFIIPNGSDLSYGVKVENILVAVDGDTVCEYIGIQDKNKKMIFEWDIVKIHDKYGSALLAVVKFGEYNSPSRPDNLGGHIGFYLEFQKYNDILRKDILFWLKNEDIEVVGNIFDSPGLMA